MVGLIETSSLPSREAFNVMREANHSSSALAPLSISFVSDRIAKTALWIADGTVGFSAATGDGPPLPSATRQLELALGRPAYSRWDRNPISPPTWAERLDETALLLCADIGMYLSERENSELPPAQVHTDPARHMMGRWQSWDGMSHSGKLGFEQFGSPESKVRWALEAAWRNLSPQHAWPNGPVLAWENTAVAAVASIYNSVQSFDQALTVQGFRACAEALHKFMIEHQLWGEDSQLPDRSRDGIPLPFNELTEDLRANYVFLTLASIAGLSEVGAYDDKGSKLSENSPRWASSFAALVWNHLFDIDQSNGWIGRAGLRGVRTSRGHHPELHPQVPSILIADRVRKILDDRRFYICDSAGEFVIGKPEDVVFERMRNPFYSGSATFDQKGFLAAVQESPIRDGISVTRIGTGASQVSFRILGPQAQEQFYLTTTAVQSALKQGALVAAQRAEQLWPEVAQLFAQLERDEVLHSGDINLCADAGIAFERAARSNLSGAQEWIASLAQHRRAA